MPPPAPQLPIHIKPGNLLTSPAIEAWVHKKLTATFRRYGPKMTAVDVHFEEVNGASRGTDNVRCVMEARVNGRAPVAVRARAQDLYAAIDAAARKLYAAVGRAVERVETRAHRRFRQGAAPNAAASAIPAASAPQETPASVSHRAEAYTPPPGPHGRVIIAGYGPVGRILAEELVGLQVPFTIVDTNPATVRTQKSLGVSAICGSASDPQVLRAAGIENATALAITIPDAEEVIRTCAVARALAPGIYIAARTTFLSQGVGALQAGATSITVAEIAAAESMARDMSQRMTTTTRCTMNPLVLRQEQFSRVTRSRCPNCSGRSTPHGR